MNFGNEMMLLLYSFFNSLRVLNVLVNPRPANCDSLTKSGQSFTSANCSRFPEACLKRRNSCALNLCTNSFLRCGQVNSVLCILLRSSMNLMIHLPRFLCICNYFCFAGIVVETNCTLPLQSKRLSSFCTSVFIPYTFFTFFSFCSQASFCNRVMITCSIHGVDALCSCQEFIHNSSLFLE